MKVKNIMAGLAAAMLSVSALYAGSPVREYRDILRLQENGMHGRSRHLFSRNADRITGGDNEGMAVLSEVIMNVPGYEARVKEFMAENPHSVLVPQITFRHALNLFDRQDYQAAGALLDAVPPVAIERAAAADRRTSRCPRFSCCFP